MNESARAKMCMAKDPVCGMNVEEKTAEFKSDYKGKTYYFCNQMCKAAFDKNPIKYMHACMHNWKLEQCVNFQTYLLNVVFRRWVGLKI